MHSNNPIIKHIRPEIIVKSLSQVLVFTLMMIAGAQIIIPTGITPIVLTTLFIYLAGLSIGKTKALLSTLLYVSLGLVGLPVFTAGHSGFQHIYGPTGGYLVGFMVASWLIGFIHEKNNRKSYRLMALVCGSISIHLPGIAWMSIQFTDNWTAMKSIYWVFIIADLLKIIFALILYKAILTFTKYSKSM